MKSEGTEIVIYGAGSIGATVGGWLAAAGIPVVFVVRPQRAQALNLEGLQLYQVGRKAAARTISIHAVSDLSTVPGARIIVLAVKNYDLELAARDIKEKLKCEPVIVALQNGVDNQSVLRRHFTKVIYGVIQYNAWRDADNIFGYQAVGPIRLGVLDESLTAQRDEVVSLFAKAFRCIAEPRITDAAKCKMLFNLSNSITALVGLGVRDIKDIGALRGSIADVIYEGMQILQAAGVQEVRLPGGGNWTTVRAMKFLPGFIINRSFRKKMEHFQMSSMVQDVYVAKRRVTELESLNGYFVRLAESVGFDARYNKALYGITKAWLDQADRRPMDEVELWSRLRAGTYSVR